MSKRHTLHTLREITLERFSYGENKLYPHFLKQPPILSTPAFLWGKSEPPFWKI